MAQDLSALSDDQLLALARAGGSSDERPFAELMRRHRDEMYRLCYRQLSNLEEAEEVCQEVFFKAFRGLKTFEGRSTFSSWLYRIALNLCYNEHRRRSRRIRESGLFPGEEVALPGPMPSPEAELLRAEDRRRLRRAMAGLKGQDSEILYLLEWEGLSYRQVADRMGLGLSAAKMRAQRARMALAKLFKEDS